MVSTILQTNIILKPTKICEGLFVCVYLNYNLMT